MKSFLKVLLVAGLVMTVIAKLCGLIGLPILDLSEGEGVTRAQPTQKQQPKTLTVEYRADTNLIGESMDLYFSNDQGGHDRISDMGPQWEKNEKGGFVESMEWSRTYQMNYGEHAYISASVNQNHRDAVVICQILINGKLVDQSKSTGPYATAICSSSTKGTYNDRTNNRAMD